MIESNLRTSNVMKVVKWEIAFNNMIMCEAAAIVVSENDGLLTSGTKDEGAGRKTLNRESSQQGISLTSHLVEKLKKRMKNFFNLRCRLYFLARC